jgi:uncharacterized membrane protein
LTSMFDVPSHFLLVHFPLVLIIAAIVADLRGNHEAGYQLTFWAAVGGALAVLTGLLQVGGQLSELPVHAGAGITGGFAMVILAVLRYSGRARGENVNTFPKAWLVIEVVAAVLVVSAAITGHRAVLGL